MAEFEFKTTEKTEAFCNTLANEMVHCFDILREQAVGRINRFWRNVDFTDELDLRFHEEISFWAMDIYYGPQSLWWQNPKKLSPLPYP